MQHVHVGNLHKMRDAPPDTWATVHSKDAVTFSELVRRGFHLVDMSGEVWTMLRPRQGREDRPEVSGLKHFAAEG